MFAIALLLQQPDIHSIDQMAQARDVAGLTQLLASVPKRNPFSVLKTGGAFAAGQKGWTAKELVSPDGARFVVLSTPIIAEDMGELLFRITPEGKLDYVPETDNMGVELDRHGFDIRFDLANGKLIATDYVDCHWAMDVKRPGSHFIFRISPTFTVKSLTDRSGVAVPFSQAGGIIAVHPGSTPLKFIVKYEGSTEKPAFDREISSKEATLCGAVWYLNIARRPAPYSIAIHSPKEWTALAQGNLASVKVEGDEKVSLFHNDLPVIWYGATAGPYKTVVDKINGKEFAVMSATLSDADMHLQNSLNSEVVDFYSKTFVPYPFKRWTSLDSWQFHGGPGALEAYSFATYPGGLPGPDSHEPSHTWWGGILNNDYLRSLWNESFAVFCTGLFARNQPNGYKPEMATAFVSVPFPFPGYDSAPLNDSGDEIGPAAAALGYGKGGFVLQMLEDDLGTDTMIKCMREWIQTNPSRHIGSWEDFEKVVNKVSGKDYKWFFDEWVRRPGYADPILEKVSWANGELSGTVSFKGEAYRIKTDILLKDKYNVNTFDRVDIQATGQFSLKVARPSAVSIDPWQKVLRKRSPAEKRETLDQTLYRLKAYIDPAHKDDLMPLSLKASLTTVPDDPAGVLFIGSPETTPAMKELCKTVGFSVTGNVLTYLGTKVDLNHGGALALVTLPDGKIVGIGMGKITVRPDFGNARLMLFNEKGRAIRALTDPVTTGPLARALEN